jgi:hypothetical protein
VKAWQGQIDAVVDGEIRSTMVPEDVWRTTSGNAAPQTVLEFPPFSHPRRSARWTVPTRLNHLSAAGADEISSFSRPSILVDLSRYGSTDPG